MELSKFFDFEDEIYIKSKKVMYNDIESALSQNPALLDMFNQMMSKIKKLDCIYDKNNYYYKTITKLLQDPFLLKFENIAEKIIDIFIDLKEYITKEVKKRDALLSLAIADLNNNDFFTHFPELLNDYVISFVIIPKKLRVINKDGYKQMVKYKNEYLILINQYNIIFQILIKFLDYSKVNNISSIKQKFQSLPIIVDKVNLIDACRNSNIPRIKEILDRDLYVKFNTYDGKTIFDIPINNKNEELIKFLISYPEIDLYVYDSNKHIPIKNAHDCDDKNIFNILLDRMLDSYTYKGGLRTTFLIWAICYGDKETYNYILNNSQVKNINLTDSNNRSALIWAIKKKNRTVTDKLLKYPGIDVNICDKYGNSPLLLSAIHKDITTMKRLIEEYKVDVNIKNTFGNTSLIIATDKKFIDIADMLLNMNSIDINASNNNKITALMYAIFKDCNEIIFKLLERPNLDINAVDNKGNSALMLSAKKGNMKVVKTLLEMPNININILNNENKTALMYSIEKNMYKIMQLLLQQNSIQINTVDNTGDTPLLAYIKLNSNNNMNKLKFLLKDKKIDVNVSDNELRTPLIVACEKNMLSAVKQLLKIKNIDLNKQDKYKNTALIFAAIHRNVNIIKMLIKQKKTDVNKYNNIRKTPLMLAIKDVKCIKVLLKRKDIDVNIRDRKGRTALFIALEKKCFDSAKLLLKNKNINPGLKDSKGLSPYDIAKKSNYGDLIKMMEKIMDNLKKQDKGCNGNGLNNSSINNYNPNRKITAIENRQSVIEKSAIISL